MKLKSDKKFLLKALLNLIKNKRCTHLSLEWAKRLDGNMVRRVFHSLPDEILLEDEDEYIRYRIFDTIRDVDGLTTEYVNYLIQKGRVNVVTLNCIRNNGELLSKCICSMIENDKFDNDILENYVNKNDKDVLSKYVDYLIKKGEVDNVALYYVKNYKELVSKCVEYLIQKDEVDNVTLGYVKVDEELLTKCVDYLIENDKVDYITLDYLEDDKELYEKCKLALEKQKK